MSFEYKSNFSNLKNRLDNSVNEALEEIGRFGTAETQARTPVDTGNLRRSEGYKTNGKDEVDIGTNIEYAEYVHNGTSKQKAQPFIKDAIIQNINEINNIIKKHLSKVGDK